ncbi:F9L1.16, putative isoform 2 [Theobroma cacao]|uniref:F9L1.16, putative isoform 2 n=1 Tax=Theobroma cacao TaxID=3641 RepID=A0A061GAK2_THECC|nr:F9L1.16, putative isoform 2 [Theobroma cacao]EOY26912.1 F9L1.16, putative isoform 2 [Theobroma cacao]
MTLFTLLKPPKTKSIVTFKGNSACIGKDFRFWSVMDDKDSWDSVSEFTLAEILEMENIYKEIGEKTLNKEFCQELATNFSCSSNRMGKSAVTWQQVQIWFQEKQMETQSKQRPSPMALELFVDLSSANSSKPPGSLRRHKGKVEDLKELSFEARSSKDYAWYDVDSFLTYRVLSTGELEVRVRFSGFAKTEDEWVNVEKAVRERSIPLEPSECNIVKIGDLVLCYQSCLWFRYLNRTTVKSWCFAFWIYIHELPIKITQH